MKKTIIIAFILVLGLITFLIIKTSDLDYFKSHIAIIPSEEKVVNKCYFIEDGGLKRRVCVQK